MKGVYRRVDKRVTDYSAALNRKEKMFVMECRMPQFAPNYTLAIIGGDAILGDWDSMRSHFLSDEDFPVWRTILPMDLCERGVEFKFVVIDKDTNFFVAWELGDNRVFSTLEAGNREFSIADTNGAIHSIEMPVVDLFPPSFDIEPWRGRGVVVPLFSVRTPRSAGIGDFGDLNSVVDWLVERKMSVLQLLPINDTTISFDLNDSYPYSINSTIALHPQYVSLRDVGALDDKAAMASFRLRAKKLNALDVVDYEGVSRLKEEYMRMAFNGSVGAKTLRSSNYKSFIAENRVEWLEAYALYRALAAVKYKSFEFDKWGKDAVFNDRVVDRYLGAFAIGGESRDIAKEFDFQCFVQYHLHSQLKIAVGYARGKGVAFKGDLPIGVNRYSVDCWVAPQLFNFGLQAGAPPDAFSAFGQNWVFPIYNWSEMANDDYRWWQRRLRFMANYFDIYRIDHILGFFRIWSIPVGSIHAQLGYYTPAKSLTVEEIEAFGFRFNAVQHTTPYITDDILERLFDEDVRNRVKLIYFIAEKSADSDTIFYHFKREYASQKLLQNNIVDDVRDREICDKLMALHDEVLFIEDAGEKGRYYPRIDGANTLIYKSLSDSFKIAFDIIYRDFFNDRNNELWLASAEAKLPELLNATDMLACGEDLGAMPAGVVEFMQEHQILSLEVERMAKSDVQSNGFGDPAKYPYLSVATTSTHDLSSLRGWWQEDREATQRYYNEVLGYGGIAPLRLNATLAEQILSRYRNTPSMLTIIPWADFMAANVGENLPNPDFDPSSERINDPSDSDHCWRYRVPQTLK